MKIPGWTNAEHRYVTGSIDTYFDAHAISRPQPYLIRLGRHLLHISARCGPLRLGGNQRNVFYVTVLAADLQTEINRSRTGCRSSRQQDVVRQEAVKRPAQGLDKFG